ncbi:DUF7321 family protein [Halorarum salinum]|uniref:DUF7321 domain-containing protein n=1 Tax=Halorarum salinum TaxID=2743089 RepID=A0A7D5LC97_9EURY|nr:hypothetical protein [Halobaculum salinum]QLG63134.1 hypothetical protein HUG12_15900 [Halobaculum salinum]
MVSDGVVAAVALVLVTASLPFYLYGAWLILDREDENVSWDLLVRHLSVILPGLVLTTGPVVLWMAPRLLDQLTGLSAVHAFLGLQAYALLLFGLTGIVRIFQVKRAADMYRDPEEHVDLNDLHEHMGAWRGRLRIGVFGYVVFWLLAYLVGVYRFYLRYVA